jgi:hypothetical protein
MNPKVRALLNGNTSDLFCDPAVSSLLLPKKQRNASCFMLLIQSFQQLDVADIER